MSNERMTYERVRDLVIENINTDTVADYLSAPSGQWLMISGDETALRWVLGDAPGGDLADIRCPGIGNIDATYFTQHLSELGDGGYDWIDERTGEKFEDLSDVIRWECENGDVVAYLEDLRDQITADVIAGYTPSQKEEEI